MTRVGITILVLASVLWAEERMTLTLLDGKKKSVVLVSADEKGLKARQGDKELHIAWTELQPASAFRARKAVTPYDEGTAIRDLAEFAVKLLLYPDALKELEIAFALGAYDQAGFEKREDEIKALEVDFLCRRIDRLLKTGRSPDVCLDAIKRLKQRYSEHKNNATYEPHIERLVEQLAKQIEQKQAAEAQKKESKELAALRQSVGKLMKRKVAALEKAEGLMKESLPAIEKRQVSRVKKKLVDPAGAEKYFKRARKYMRSMARVDRQFRIVNKAKLQEEYEAIEAKLVVCYLRVARILIKGRNYKGAVKYVRNILFYDPINEEALDMVDEIKRNRITFRASDITNTRPRVTGG